MTVYFVTRHPGAVDWARSEGFPVDKIVSHLDPKLVEPGDLVLGTLPVHLAAAVVERGGRYLHLTLDIPPEARGRELTAEEMRKFGARLEEYKVLRVEGKE